jgi:hypothetical protein
MALTVIEGGGPTPEQSPSPTSDGEGTPPVQPPPQPPPTQTDGLGERVAKLETAIEGIRHGQNLMLGGIGLIVALIIYSLTRIDSLPDEFKSMNSMLAQAIGAASSKPTQVVVVPAAALPPATK